MEEASVDDDTIKQGNTTPTKSSDIPNIERAGPLTFDPCPDKTQEEQPVRIASDVQAELMHWHYHLGHLSFPKLKILAKLDKIPKHLANV